MKIKFGPLHYFHLKDQKAIKSSNLRMYASEVANIPLWLFEESYHIVVI